MVQSRMLNFLLGCTSKVEILRVLFESDDAMTGRRIASLAGISPRSCQLSLDSLVKNRAIFRKAVGRAYSYTLNREHKMVWDQLRLIFEHERNLNKEAAQVVVKLFKPYPQNFLSLFWSLNYDRTSEVARYLIVVEKRKEIPEKDLVKQIALSIERLYGFASEGEIISQADFTSKFSSDNARRRFDRDFEKIKGLSFGELTGSIRPAKGVKKGEEASGDEAEAQPQE